MLMKSRLLDYEFLGRYNAVCDILRLFLRLKFHGLDSVYKRDRLMVPEEALSGGLFRMAARRGMRYNMGNDEIWR